MKGGRARLKRTLDGEQRGSAIARWEKSGIFREGDGGTFKAIVRSEWSPLSLEFRAA